MVAYVLLRFAADSLILIEFIKALDIPLFHTLKFEIITKTIHVYLMSTCIAMCTANDKDRHVIIT
jgi:hypothetical protein